MSIKNLIFDFDGTIADTFEKSFDTYNRLAKKYNYKPIKNKKMNSATQLNVQTLIRRSKINLLRIPQLITEAHKILAESINHIQPFEGLTEVLNTLGERYFMSIVTSNHKNNVLNFLNRHQLNIFDDILAGKSIIGKHAYILKLIKKHNLLKQQSIYIGDEARDVEASKRSDIKVIAVSWGYNRSTLLQKSSPDYLIHSPKELLPLLESLSTSP